MIKTAPRLCLRCRMSKPLVAFRILENQKFSTICIACEAQDSEEGSGGGRSLHKRREDHLRPDGQPSENTPERRAGDAHRAKQNTLFTQNEQKKRGKVTQFIDKIRRTPQLFTSKHTEQQATKDTKRQKTQTNAAATGTAGRSSNSATDQQKNAIQQGLPDNDPTKELLDSWKRQRRGR